uniref:Uncharacterized protein LOC102803892 n=1 Tax=Saccoglossus kowalevskii TaxID=10224 RepID=A0ABM0MCE8_SACKO|nr:PREDICTED: uncharacterized protein LOC102803892 [Saccoglossus kowalevskii]
MAWNKTPGNDGILVEFYVQFWPLVGELLTASLNFGYKLGVLSNSQKQSVISLIEKKAEIQNLLRIGGSYCLYMLMQRLGLSVSQRDWDIINDIQGAFVAGRDISDCIRLIEKMLWFADENKIPGMLIAVDFQKALDMLEWDSLMECLEAFQFGHIFQK